MNSILRATLVLILTPCVASAQLIVPTAQDRGVEAMSDADGGTPQNNSASASDFGLFDMTVNADSSGAGGSAMSSASQTSEILADSFVVSGVQSGSTSFDGTAASNSSASIDFDVTAKVAYQVMSSWESYDGGYSSYELKDLISGTYVNGWAGIPEGHDSVEHTGILDPGSYSILFMVDGQDDYSFAEFDAAFHLTEIWGAYCVAAPNSAGPGAEVAVGGTQSIAANDFRIDATGVAPGVFGLVFYGPSQIQAPFGDGFRCVGGQTHRIQPPVQADGSGILSKALDFNIGPLASGSGMVTPESTWRFQLWYRDPMGPGGTGFNTSNAVWATFCP